MLDFPRWKVISISLLLVFGVMMSLPSVFFGESHKYWPTFLPDETINLGLDLSGGSHILLEADPAEVGLIRLETMEESVRAGMRRAEPRIGIGDISRRNGELSFMVRDSTQVDAAREVLLTLTAGSGLPGQRDWDIEVRDDTRFVLTPTESGLETAVDNAMDTATDVIRRRIDEMGTREPTIIRQGDERIVVQVPGLDDPEALKELLGKTAKLEFKLVDFEADPSAVAAGRAPVGSQIFPYPDNPAGFPNLAVKRLGGISGDKLTDASAGKDATDNTDVVNITFDAEGGAKFARLTEQNVGRPFAIILDGEILSAPNINEPIRGGSAQISGSFNADSANQLSIALRSGALPVDLKIVEERTVGPDLGADSIRKGMIAAIIGTSAVLAFMVITYGRFGMYANFALTLNLFLILGIMAMFNATLTLPGIAGFILTVGSAVDANVLINERIREERRRGRRVVQAVEVGYKEASRAIFDANITNVIAGLLLFIFGSGPVRGFAVVLIIGICTSVFTALVVTRMWVALWLRRRRPQELVI
jgi:preprotein translocase subunit SecD